MSIHGWCMWNRIIAGTTAFKSPSSAKKLSKNTMTDKLAAINFSQIEYTTDSLSDKRI